MSNTTIISNIGSERATVGGGNKIVTRQGKTHVAWQDITREGYLNRVRSLNRESGDWSEPYTFGTGLDNHARPILTVDHDGYLHAVLGGHNSPVTSRKSVRPNDSSEWTEPELVGEGTYPVLICGPDNTLFLTLRANRHAGVDFYAKTKGEPWVRRCRIVANAEKYREAYGAFPMQMMMDGNQTIHAAIDFYEGEDDAGRGLYMAVTYCRSYDGGWTWMKADGSQIEIPARPEQMDTLAQSVESRVEKLPRSEHSNCGMLVDTNGKPHIPFLSHRAGPGELFLVSFDDSGNQVRKAVHPDLQSRWPDARVTEARGTILSDDTIYLVVTMSLYNDEWIDGRPSRDMGMVERTDQRLVWAKTSDYGVSWEVESVIDPGQTFNAPNIETPVGANQLPADVVPTFAYFDGTRGYPGGGDYYNKPVEEYLSTGEFAENRVVLVSF